MKRHRLLLSVASLLGLGFNFTAHAQSYTDPVGAVNIGIPSGNVALAPVFVHPDSFVGSISSLSEDASTTQLTLSGANFTAAQFDGALYPLYYLEVVQSGEKQGFCFDIVSSTTDSVVVVGLLSTDFGILNGEQVAIRKHMTIGDLFSDATGLSDFDAVTIYEDDGTPVAYFYVGGIWSSDFGTTDHSNKPVYPGSGLVTGFANPISLTVFGSVKTTATKIPLYANGLNIVTAINPVEKGIANLNLESGLAEYEAITTYAFDGNFSNPVAYFNFPGVGWTSDFSTETTDTTEGYNAFVAAVSFDSYWTAPAPYVQ